MDERFTSAQKKGNQEGREQKNKVLIILSGFVTSQVKRLAKANCGVLIGNASSV